MILIGKTQIAKALNIDAKTLSSWMKEKLDNKDLEDYNFSRSLSRNKWEYFLIKLPNITEAEITGLLDTLTGVSLKPKN